MTRTRGTLFVVATPIGNLEDLTFRALRILGEVDLIAAEDTRRTAKLLAHYGIRRPVVSLHAHNEGREGPRLVRRMVDGETVALVSDAGTPGISDPGAHLVRLARDAGLTVTPIPGCSAVTAALSVSGFVLTSFRFAGFPPTSGKARENWFIDLSSSDEVVVFLEAPHRISDTVEKIAGDLPNRRILIFRELTKVHESYGEYSKTSPYRANERGELTVVVAPENVGKPDNQPDDSELRQLFGDLTNGRRFSQPDALDLLVRVHRDPIPHARNRLKKALLLAKRQNIADP
jgi:16S rRNA (cytidine1402-2'-O)-methyltransferase